MIYAIVGPTGVGKTKLSVLFASKINAEIINCDSMQIYQELNIGVAKIREDEKMGVVHHLFDIVSIKEDFSVYEYQHLAREKIAEILSKGKNVVIVGGTGLYLKALLYDYKFDGEVTSKKLYDFRLIGLTKNREALYADINLRVDSMINEGLVLEARNLYNDNVRTRAVLTAIGYKELYSYFEGDISLEEAISKIKLNSRRYAKRQYTFFRNQFDNIIWYNVDDLTIEKIVEIELKEKLR